MNALKRIWYTLSDRISRWRLTDPAAAKVFPSQASVAGVDVDQHSALSLSAIFSAVNLLGNVVGMLPLDVYRVDGINIDKVPSHSVAWLLGHEPNPEMTAITFRCVMELHRLLWGNCYAEIEWSMNGQPKALWPIYPWRVMPYRLPDWSLVYRIDGWRNVHPHDMVHCQLISWDGVVGRSFIDYAFESLGLSIATQQYAAAFFGNGARPGVILEHPGPVADPEREKIRKGWADRHQGPRKAGGTAMIWGGWKVNFDQSMSPEASQLLEQRRFSTEEVARWLNIPPHLLRDLSRATFSNIEEQGLDFSRYSLGPICTRYEQEWNRKLLSPPGTYCKHDLSGLERGNSAAKSAFYREMWGIGAMSINEIRAKENMNPIEGGEEYWVPVNMTTLDQATAAEEAMDNEAPGQEDETVPGGDAGDGSQPTVEDKPPEVPPPTGNDGNPSNP